MKINIISVGKLSGHYVLLFHHYFRMLKKYADMHLIEIKEAPLPSNETPGDINRALLSEGKTILSKIKEREFVYVLTPAGDVMDSVAFSEHLSDAFIKGGSNVTFVIGSSYGLSAEVYARANFKLSFGPMTLPHELARIVTAEQLVRAFKIKYNERYHK